MYLISTQLRNEAPFLKIMEQYEYIKNGTNRQFLAPFVYDLAFQNSFSQLLPALILLLFFTLAFSHSFTYEYRHELHHVLACSVKGRKTIVNHKVWILISLMMLACIIAYLPNLSLLYDAYGFPALSASLTSLPFYEHFPFPISIFSFFILLFLLRMFAYSFFSIILVSISVRYKSQLTAVFACFVLFLLPLFLSFSKIYILDVVSLYPLIVASVCFTDNIGMFNVLVSFLVYGLLTWYCYRYLCNHSVT